MTRKKENVVLTTVLGTLTPDTAEEATTLIPSLNMDEEELQLILDELNKMRELEKINKMATGP
jgi:DNA-directed RNA polymerase II subunit RPB4